jgi:hypothetical protein
MTDKINPSNFVFDSPASIERSRINREYMKENQHLALQFPIPELRSYFHPTFPGRTTMIIAQSHNFKTEWMNFWAKTAAVELAEQTKSGKRRGIVIKVSTEDVIEGLVESEIASFDGGMMDDITLGNIKNPDAFVQAETIVGGLPVVHIGESLGMDDDSANSLCLSNVKRLVNYVKYDHFGEETPIAAIFADYLQAFPFDPENAIAKNYTDSRTLQINRDTDTLRRMAKEFKCPVVVNAQGSPDRELSSITSPIKLPGYWDVHWSKYPSQRFDFMYSLWLPKQHYKIGEWVDENPKKEYSKWNFQVKNNSLWIKSLKHKKFSNVGASFPLLIAENGNVSYDKDLHDRIKTMEKGL